MTEIRFLKAIRNDGKIIYLGYEDKIDSKEKRAELIKNFSSNEFHFIMGNEIIEDRDTFVFYLDSFFPFAYVAVEWNEDEFKFEVMQEESTYDSAFIIAKTSHLER